MNLEEYKKYVKEMCKNIKEKLDEESEEFVFFLTLVKTFNKICNENRELENTLDEIEKYIKEYQEERTYTDRGGFTCSDGHFLRDSDVLLEIIKKAKGDVKNENIYENEVDSLKYYKKGE